MRWKCLFEFSGSAVVLHDGQFLAEVIVVQSRQQPDFDHDLESIADAHNQFAILYELLQSAAQPMPGSQCNHMPGGHMIALRESADDHQRRKIGIRDGGPSKSLKCISSGLASGG
jgi:hypothetical protein